METLSLRSKSPSAYSVDNNAWASPVEKEALELSNRKRNAVLNMIEKNWKLNIRSKIESDLSDQVQQALAPLTSLKRRAEKKSEKQKNLQLFKVNGYTRNRFQNYSNSQSNGNSGSFKYIDVNYIPQSKFLSGRGNGLYTKEYIPRSWGNVRLPKRHELQSQSLYNFDEMTRARKHASNIRGGLDVTLLDTNSNVNLLPLLKNEDGELRPFVPNVINYNGISLPNYGANRKCFQMYTKDGMSNLLNSRARRGKLTQLPDGRFVDKRGVVISRLGPFWPQGYGPVCQCPEFITDCPDHEHHWEMEEKLQQQQAFRVDEIKRIAAAGPTRSMTIDGAGDNSRPGHRSGPTLTSNPISNNRDMSSKPTEEKTSSNIALATQQSTINKVNCENSISKLAEPNQISRNLSTSNLSNNFQPKKLAQLSPRDDPLKPPINPGGKRQVQNGGKSVWKGKPVIYDCDRSSRSPLPHSVPEGMDESLVFESRFESGNLRQVRRIGEFEYELVLRTDMYTNRHTQWYYFRVQKAQRDRVYKFNIINFLKKDSLYNYGMKPLIYSEKLAANQQLGWHRIGENIRYAAWNNPTRNAILSLDLQYYCLEFDVSFDWEEIGEDTIYLAHCYPYTYSDLRRHLDLVMANPTLSQHVKKEVLCETTAGNACFLLTITEFPDQEKDKYKDFHQEKQGVVITARVHPGETQSSWMMKGVIEHLISDHPIAKQLRQKFIFKIVPMLNPDGVIVGNYRTSLAARDLNRNYRHPRQDVFPTIWHTKQMVDQFNKDHPIILYCDLHGHSRKHMVFMYGCERKAYYQNMKNNRKQIFDGSSMKTPEKPVPVAEKSPDSLNETRDFVEERLFPWLMHKLTPSRFSFHGTKFAVRRSKESTGRVVMFRQMGIWNSFTMEASFSGTRMNKESGRHFNIDDFQLIGRKLCDCVLEYSQVCQNSVAKSRAILEMTRAIAQQLLQSGQLAASSSELKSNEVKGGNSANPINKNPAIRRNSTAGVNNFQQNYSHVKSTIAKQIRKNKTSKAQENQSVNKEKGDVIVSRSADDGNAATEQSANVGVVNGEKAKQEEESGAIGEQELPEQEGVDDNCFRLLQSLNVHQIELESETSSESNSDSEPELAADVSVNPGKMRGTLANSGGGKKKKRKKRQQKYVKSISAPSKIQSLQSGSKKTSDEHHAKENKSKPNYPSYVNKYANRSNGGIPIFAQERMEERAARRLAELKLAEKDRKQQEKQLREQLLLAGIQDGPSIHYDMSTTQRLATEHSGYSDVCGVRYRVANPAQRVQYMISNPYRGNSPTSTRDRHPVVTMRFSPPSQLRHVVAETPRHHKPTSESNVDLYMPYRVQAAGGRLSNQRGLSSLTEFSGSVTESNPTEPSSSQSSDRGDREEEVNGPDDQSNESRFEPRSVVVPVQKYNVSFNMYKKAWKQKAAGNLAGHGRFNDVEELDVVSVHQEPLDSDLRQPNVSELFLPPNMDASEVMTAHMRYPAQVHRIEAMRPLPRGRTISREPPMVFGEPAPFNQKLNDPELSNELSRRSLTNPSIITKQKLLSNQQVTGHGDVMLTHSSDLKRNENSDSTQASVRENPQPLFVPRFVALDPKQKLDPEIRKGSLSARSAEDLPGADSNPKPYTVR